MSDIVAKYYEAATWMKEVFAVNMDGTFIMWGRLADIPNTVLVSRKGGGKNYYYCEHHRYVYEVSHAVCEPCQTTPQMAVAET